MLELGSSFRFCLYYPGNVTLRARISPFLYFLEPVAFLLGVKEHSNNSLILDELLQLPLSGLFKGVADSYGFVDIF